MATRPPSSEATAQIATEGGGQELRNRRSARGSEIAGANQMGEEEKVFQEANQLLSNIKKKSIAKCEMMAPAPKLGMCMQEKKGQEKKEMQSVEFSPLVIHIVTGWGSWLWPFRSHNGSVKITLYGENKEQPLSREICIEQPAFKPGEIYSFKVPKHLLENPEGPSEKVSWIKVFNGCKKSCLWQWHLDKVVVENTATYDLSVFSYKRWIKGQTYYFQNADENPKMPDHDEKSDQELQRSRETYQYRKDKENGKSTTPAQVKDNFWFRFSEWFYPVQLWKIFWRTQSNIRRTKDVKNMEKFQKVSKQSWKSMGDLLAVYGLQKGTLPLPPVNKRKTWMDDLHFGYQRINGLNHSLIELCTEIPPCFDKEKVKNHLNIERLAEALDKQRLFVVDLKILENISVLKRDKPTKLCAPIGLFFSTNEQELLPVAIQLERDPDAPVFYADKDNSIEWQLVKMWFNNSDAIYHQSVAHLGLTHLLMEGVAVATYRQLPSGHPVYKLLKPHFLQLMFINKLARDSLLADGGYIDKTLTTGAKGTLELIEKALEHWRLDVDGTLPESLKERGLDDPKVLPAFHYREDALELYNAILKYVTEYANMYYDNEKLARDMQIMAWAAELARDRNSPEGGCGIKGVPGFTEDIPKDKRKLSTVDQLVTILTSIIFTCSVEHAAVNFGQYEEYGYPINYPSLLNGNPPRDTEREYTKKDILEALPTPEETLDIMVITDVLSQKFTNSLGQFETVYFTENKPLGCLAAFQGTLQEIQREIKDKNDSRRRSHYKHLNPLSIPNAISI